MNIEDDSRLECFTRRKLIYVRIGKVSNFLIDLHLRRAEWNKERTRHKLKSLAKWKLLFNWMRREKTFLPVRRTKQYFSKPIQASPHEDLSIIQQREISAEQLAMARQKV